jgi:hypothetical protein
MPFVRSKKSTHMLHRRNAGILLLLLMIGLMAGSCGCVRLMQQQSGDGVAPASPTETTAAPASGSAGATPGPGTTTAVRPSPTATPGPDLQVYSAAPDVTPDLYPVQHGTRINQTGLMPRYVTPLVTRTYALGGAPVGLGVNVTNGPFLIYFTINPKVDCLSDPDSCRGTLGATVNRPYCTITVTDNQTHNVVAKDGYAREFSSNRTDRSITIYGAGQYLITLEGNYLDITLSLASGDPTPVPTAAPAGKTTPPSGRRPGPWGQGV